MNLKVVSTYETRNPKRTAKVSFNRRNPKPETRNRQRKLVSGDETRNPKPETDSESWFQATKPETRNPKPTAKVGFNRRNPKPETRNPKPTRIRLLGGSPDRNSFAFQFCLHCCIHWYSHILTPTAFFERCSVKIAFL